MRIALIADIHANREAFSAVLAHATERRVDHMVILGDLVGYGADPNYVIDVVQDLMSRGATVLIGNHDAAIAFDINVMNPVARTAIDWTRERLNLSERAFLASLPLTHQVEDRLYVHASAALPDRWRYISDIREAKLSFDATMARMTFCGHTHQPMLFHQSAGQSVESFVPSSCVAVPLLRSRRWIAVIGSVGQPRDGNPAAAYAVFDSRRHEIVMYRVPYDIHTAARKIRAAGLPESLASRLARGG